jgi:hypothetical protein
MTIIGYAVRADNYCIECAEHFNIRRNVPILIDDEYAYEQCYSCGERLDEKAEA